MKKPISFSGVAIFIILIPISFIIGCSECTNSSRDITVDSVQIYAGYYSKMVSTNPASAVQQSFLTNKELSCLSKLSSGELKFIFAAYDPNNVNTKFIIVEVDKKDIYSFYDLDDMYPRICPARLDASIKSSSHLCPPPSDCGIPLHNK